ncbi:MAG: hypothetical protein JWQ97_1237 [Phenylobacterium sp.]|nr:hypothetical protein [Phenylobacterium sp.]
MKKERFEELAEAYGGEIARWPAEVREDAALLAAAELGFAQAVLAREARLDATLDVLPRVSAPAALFERIVAAAPAVRRRRSWSLWIAPAGLGAALAAVAAAGVMLGAQVGEHTALSTDTSAQAVADLDVSAVPAVSEEG